MMRIVESCPLDPSRGNDNEGLSDPWTHREGESPGQECLPRRISVRRQMSCPSVTWLTVTSSRQGPGGALGADVEGRGIVSRHAEWSGLQAGARPTSNSSSDGPRRGGGPARPTGLRAARGAPGARRALTTGRALAERMVNEIETGPRRSREPGTEPSDDRIEWLRRRAHAARRPGPRQARPLTDRLGRRRARAAGGRVLPRGRARGQDVRRRPTRPRPRASCASASSRSTRITSTRCGIRTCSSACRRSRAARTTRSSIRPTGRSRWSQKVLPLPGHDLDAPLLLPRRALALPARARVGRAPEGALLGAAAFVFAPNLVAVGSHGHGSQLVDSAYLPLLLWLAARWMRRGGLTDLGVARARRRLPAAARPRADLLLHLARGRALRRGRVVDGVPPAGALAHAHAARRGGRRARRRSRSASPASTTCRSTTTRAGRSAAAATAAASGMDYATQWSLAPFELPIARGAGLGGLRRRRPTGAAMPFTDYPNAYVGMIALLLALLGVRGRRERRDARRGSRARCSACSRC